MPYEILRSGRIIPVKDLVILEKELGSDATARVTIWQGHDEKLGPHGCEVDDDSLHIQREPLITIPGRNAGVDNMVNLGPEYFQAEDDVVIGLAGEEIRVIYQAESQ